MTRAPLLPVGLGVAAILICLAITAPEIHERLNHRYVQGVAPGYHLPDLQLPSRPCLYSVRRWGRRANQPHGPVVSWHVNGRMASLAWNVDGRNEGIAQVWDADGKLVIQERWVNGVCEETRWEAPWYSEDEVGETIPDLWIPLPERPGSVN